jgi:hypothetical protein
MTRRIRLKVYQSRYRLMGDVNVIDGVRLRIEASDAEDMPNKIFAYLLMPMKPSTLERVGNFDHVCSPVDLEEYPEDEPLANVEPAFFRLDYIDIEVRSQTELDKWLQDITADVDSLKASLDIMDDVELVREIWIGPPPAESSSSSDSSSSESA